MTLDTLIILIGAIVAILPFLGFPITWDHPLFFILGICVVILGIAVRRKLHQRQTPTVIAYTEEVEEILE